ncbi:MAG TPA: right-handed parallel beta-helix repeat-containing protein, partial [Kofleriaceae bacterium]|nr:right-handed parallel beta-helix repeat-containing protein [Kofleriaceae bacterium]
ILYASPSGVTSGPCSEAAPCTLPYAVSIADATHHVIELEGNTFTLNGKLELAFEGLHLVPTQGSKPVITTPSGTVLHVTKSVELDSIEVSGTNDDIIVCDGSAGRANLVLEQVSVHGSTRDSINSNKCNVTIERSRIYANKETAVWVDDAVINLRNSFIYSNGATDYQYAAVVLRGDTTGKLLFNTISYNLGYDQTIGIGKYKTEIVEPSSLDCDQNGNNSVAVTGNLFIEDGKAAVRYTSCSGNYTTDNLIGKAPDASFLAPPTDLHLTPATPTGNGKVRDDGNTNCADDGQDIDGDARPQNNACDYGADEFTPMQQ